jgi:hypothetical protein
VILHLAATQSLEHALGDAAPPLWQCGLIVLALAAAAAQVRALSELSGFFLLGTVSQVGRGRGVRLTGFPSALEEGKGRCEGGAASRGGGCGRGGCGAVKGRLWACAPARA